MNYGLFLKTRLLHQNLPYFNVIREKSSNCDLKGKLAIITGGANGIGLASAQQLLKHGVAAVALGDIHREDVALKEICGGWNSNRTMLHKSNVNKSDQFKALIKATVEKHEQFDILINKPDISSYEEKLKVADVESICAGSVSNYKITQEFEKQKERNGERMVFEQSSGSPIYMGTKHSLIGFDRSVTDCWQYKDTGIKVLTINPGIMSTSLTDNVNKKAIENLNYDMRELFEDKACVQTTEACRKHMVTIITKGCSGNIWMSEANKCCSVRVPERKLERVCNNKQNSAEKSLSFTQVFIRRVLTNKPKNSGNPAQNLTN